MNPRVKAVVAIPDFSLMITFTNGEKKRFNMRPYLHIGDFKELQNWEIFKTVRPFLGSIQWANELDLDPDRLYEDGEIIFS